MNLKSIFSVVSATAIFAIFAPGPVVAGSYETIIEECGIQLEMTPSACTCIADKAQAELSDQQVDFLIAQITDDNSNAPALIGAMTIAEMTTVSEFMESAPAACQGQ